MPKKEPLFPHVPKSRSKGSQVEVIETGDRDWFKVGIHLRNPSPEQIEDAKEDALNKGFDTVYAHRLSSLVKEPLSQRLKELETEALELQRKIRAKYPERVPEPWPEELQRWQGRLWQLGYEIVREQERLKTR